MIENQSLVILQYNVNNFKSKIIISMFEIDDILNYDILIIQKSWKNSYFNTINNKLNQYFDTYYMNNVKIKVCFFINKRIILIFYTITYHNENIKTISLRLSKDRTINIHNLYNSCKESDEKSVISILRKILEKDKDEKHIILENFNLHHSKWEENYIIANAKAYELIVMIEKYRLKRTFSIEIIIWRRDNNESTIDLTFITSLLRESAIDVEIATSMNNHSNHYSIKTFFELRTIAIKTRLKRNWEKIDFALLQQTLKKIVSYEKNFISTSQHDNSKS